MVDVTNKVLSFPVAGLTITRVCLDYAFVLLMDEGSELRIEQALSITGESLEPVTVRPDPLDTRIAFAFRVVNRRVARAWADESGRLEIQFEGPLAITVEPHPQYEAWTYAGSQGEKAISVPGGGLTTWGLG